MEFLGTWGSEGGQAYCEIKTDLDLNCVAVIVVDACVFNAGQSCSLHTSG